MDGAPPRVDPPSRLAALLGSRWLVLVVFAVVAAPLVGAPFFGEDLTSLASFHREGLRRAWDDWFGTMFGLTSVRFYRPLFSTSLALQTAISFDPVFLRAVNLALYALGVLAARSIALRLGAGAFGATFAALWAILFPGGPSDWCWIVGRVDALSFGLGLLGLDRLLRAGDGGAGRRERAQVVLAAAALLGAFLSKETAIAFAPAALLLGYATSSWAGVRRALVPCAALAVGFLARSAALDFSLGGYVGSPAGGAAFAGALAPGILAAALGLATGVPAAFALPALGAAAASGAALLALSADRRRLLAFAAALLSAAGLALPGALVIVGLEDPPPIHARVFPAAYALLGVALAIPLGDPRIPRVLAVLAAALLLLAPGRALVKSVQLHREAARVVAEETARIDAARSARPEGISVLLVAGLPFGHPPARPQVNLFNFGVADRFAPPFHGTARPAVWPLRRASSVGIAEPIRIPRGSALAPWCLEPPAGTSEPGILWVEPDPVPRWEISEDALPRTLTGAQAQAMDEGRLDVSLRLPPSPPGTTLRVTVFSPQGCDVALLDAASATWKSILAARTPSDLLLFHVPGYAADFGARSFLLWLEWIAPEGRRLAESSPIEVRTDEEFRSFVTRSLSDPAFRRR